MIGAATIEPASFAIALGDPRMMKAAIAFAALTLTCSAHANLLVNGSFEVGPSIPSNGYLTLPGGDTSIMGWEALALAPGGTIDYNGSFWQHSDGLRSIDLNGTGGPGGIKQEFTTIPGHVYDVLFDVAGTTSSEPGAGTIMTGRITASGTSAAEFTVDTEGHTYQEMQWETRAWQFTATESTTTLVFEMVFPFIGNEGIALDNVVVTVDLGPPPPGDANGDYCVTGADYTIWADNFDNGAGPGGKTWQQGDWTGEGYVSGADYTVWADNYGYCATMVTVPEPSAWAMAIASACAIGGLIRAREQFGRANAPAAF